MRRDHYTVKIIQFSLKFLINGETVVSVKYQKLKIVVWSVVLWSDVRRRRMFMWQIMI